MAVCEALHELFAVDWQWEMLDNPEFASQAGYHDATDGILQDVSVEAYDRRGTHSKIMLAQLSEIERNVTLSKSDAVHARLFRSMHEDLVEALEKCPLFLIPINSMGTGGVVCSFVESVEWMPFENKRDFDIYYRRLLNCPKQVSQFTDCMRHGMDRNIVASTAFVQQFQAQLEECCSTVPPELRFPLQSELALSLLSAEDLLNFDAAFAAVLTSFQEFLKFYKEEYLCVIRSNPGCSAQPNGDKMYSVCLKYHTTTTLTADQIHQIGIEEVAAIEEKYKQDVLIPLGFDENDFASFVEHANADPQFYVASTETLLAHYQAACDEIHLIMPTFFNEIPKSPMEILAKYVGPAAYYISGTADGKRPGRFYVNVSNIEKRPLYETMSLAIHEAIPGHHHQGSIAMENETLPKFLRHVEDRRYEVGAARRNMYTAYLEEEMGVYKTPYDIFGRLSMEMMRAVRLVVDTGIHHQGWSIDKAVTYMMDKTGMHRHEVEVEIYRYATWPGQACAYKIGQREFLRLRKKAETELNSSFNLKDFHSVCLNSGPVPLYVLEMLVDDYVSSVKSSTSEVGVLV